MVSLDKIYTDINPEQYKAPDTFMGALQELAGQNFNILGL
jgi:hypothetical protein